MSTHATIFKKAVTAHLDDPATVVKGTYQYVCSKVHFNPNTNLVVILDETGNFVSGWKLSPETPQYLNFINKGILR
jgi:filamentous hemagglutinin